MHMNSGGQQPPMPGQPYPQQPVAQQQPVTPHQFGGPGGQPPSKPMSPGAKRALIASLISVGVIAVVAIAGVVAISLMNQSRDPAIVVKDYLEHIAEGRAEAANEMVDHGYSSSDAFMLTDEVLGGATERIEIISVETDNKTGDRAWVSADYELDGTRYSEEFELRKGPNEFLVLDTWELRTPLVGETQVYAWDAGFIEPQLGGVAFELEGDEYYMERSIALYPGVYEVTGGGSEYMTVEPVTVTVAPWEWSEALLEVTTTPAFEEEILNQVREATEWCLTPPNNEDWACPYETSYGDFAEMRVLEPATHLDYLDHETFESSWITIEYRLEDEEDVETSDVYLWGYIEWQDGEPVIVDWYF